MIDSAKFKGESEIEALRTSTEASLQQYVAFARKLGMKADFRFLLGTEAVDESEKLAIDVKRNFRERSSIWASSSSSANGSSTGCSTTRPPTRSSGGSSSPASRA